MGARFDYSDIEELGSDSRVNPKFGAVLKPFAGTAMRASFGMGFRAPSLAEAFTTTNISGIRVIPNTDNLKSERSISMEAGINQLVGDWLVFDISLFHNDFWDLVEPTFAKYDIQTGEFLIQFRNITRAQIRGAEFKIDSRYFNNFLNINLGYTYVDPRDLEKDEFLTFRPRHLFYGGGRINFSVFQLGADYRYISRYDRIDELFTDPLLRIFVPDLEKRVEAHIVDLRLASTFPLFNQPFRISFQANNIFQYNYVEAVGLIAPIRNFVVTFETGI
jgi:iron complex outermembrane receptor protein